MQSVMQCVMCPRYIHLNALIYKLKLQTLKTQINKCITISTDIAFLTFCIVIGCGVALALIMMNNLQMSLFESGHTNEMFMRQLFTIPC